MSDKDPLQEIQDLLKHPFIRKRKEGIRLGQQLMDEDQHCEQVRALLEKVATQDLINSVRQAAQQALEAYDCRNKPRLGSSSPGYIFKATCPDRHINYYDKREYCPKKGNVVRRTFEQDGVVLDEILVKCKEKDCGQEFFVRIPCEGYK